MIKCFKDPTYVLMRVLLCKIQCPSFICFCKPSPHLYAAASLKLENTPQVSSSTSTIVVDDDDQYDDALVEEDVDHVNGLLSEVKEEDEGQILRSSLKKEILDSADGGRREKKRVQWVDLIGKELAEIREFESSEEEEEDIIYDGDKSCVCIIL